MSASSVGIRFETDPVVFELQRQGWRDQQDIVLLVPKSMGVIEPDEVRIEPAETPHKFRFTADKPEWEESPEDQDEPNRLRIGVTCSGGTDGMEDAATLTLRWKSGTAQVRLLAGVNRVLPLPEVLREEYRELRPDLAAQLDALAANDANVPPAGDGVEVDQDKERLRQLYGVLHADRDGLAALCFSGGGIRSATFNLGVLQGLASLGILDRFHYLSTVSGGGYIGSWLSSWIHRSGDVAPLLAGPQPDPAAPETGPLRHLRQYSNYLNPKLGVFSADTWTLVAIVVRNLLLNALVLLPILAALLTLPLLALSRVTKFQIGADPLFITAFAFGTLGLFFENLLRASAEPRPGKEAPAWSRAFLRLGLVPLLIGTAFLIVAVDRYAPGGDFTFQGVLLRCAIWAIGMPLLAYLAAVVLQKPLLGRQQSFPVSDLIALVSAGAVITLVYAGILSQWAAPLVSQQLYLYPILGPILVLGPLLLGKTLFIAFASPAEEYSGGRFSAYGDADREWWARWSAWILISMLTWSLGSALVFFAPFLVGETKARIAAWIAAGGLGALTSLLGKSGGTDKEAGDASPWRRYALALAAPLFCLALLVVVSATTQDLLIKVFGKQAHATASEQALLTATEVSQETAEDEIPEESSGAWLTTLADHPPFSGKAWQVLLAVASLLGFGTVMGYFVNVNRFSLQGMYRNRLVRAYLGASNTRRRPNLFTGFDPHDNLRMHELRKNRPFHVVNMALNLVAGKELAWQQRKADVFTATPLHCGAANLGYRRSQVYGNQQGLSLGTAMATSGAAANPNMGFYSSPPVTFIMTLFNARLGIWLGNPGKLGRYTASRSGPRFSSRVIFGEALGFTDSSHPYVNLSDGGHFENLGLYEMVRRRCRFIVVCDGGGDPACAFNDLGNAIRKVRIDLGIPIDFDQRIHIYPKPATGKEPRPDARYGAVGTIRYSQVDGAGVPDGTLIYVKPSICGTEPYDVTNYATSSPTFPHESTADQWFDETQFESYRALGKAEILKMAGPGPVPDLADFLKKMEKYVGPPEAALPKVEVILPALAAMTPQLAQLASASLQAAGEAPPLPRKA